MSPEIVDHLPYDEKVDIWSSGAVVYVLLTGKPPFNAASKAELYEKIRTIEPDFSGPEWEQVSSSAIDFIKACMRKKASERPSCEDLLKMEWLDEASVTKASLDPECNKHLTHVSQNMVKFCNSSSFQKTVISIITGLKVQTEEIKQIRD
jgi:serine/threonine protein kinase